MNLLSTLALCGPSVMEESLKITHSAGILAVFFVLGSVSVSIFRRSFKWVPLYGALFLLHPTWTMPITEGCGVFVRFVSIATSLVLGATLFCQIFWPDVSGRRFLISLCVMSWVAYFSSIYLAQFWNGLFEKGFVNQALASLKVAQSPLMVIAPVLSLICFVQWLWYRLQPNRVNDSAREKRPHSSKVGLRLLWIALSCFFLSYVAFYGYRFIKTGLIAWPVEPMIALGIGIFLIVAAIRGRFPGWDLSASRHSIGANS
jgi:hypothetical protein